MGQIKITLTKSPIGRIPAQRRTVKALGLGKLGSSVVKEDTPVFRGMAKTIAHLVVIEKIDGKTAKKVSDKKAATEKSITKSAGETTTKSKGIEKPNTSSKVADIKAYLDDKGIKYPSTAKKADLLSLVK